MKFQISIRKNSTKNVDKKSTSKDLNKFNASSKTGYQKLYREHQIAW